MTRHAGRVTIDIGTGDGRLPYTLARQAPERLFVGVDANAAGLREFSGRAARRGLANLVYVRAAVEQLPRELAGAADEVTVVLPWGSLLAAVARPSVSVLRDIRAPCRANAALTVVLSVDTVRDGAESRRLGLPALDDAQLRDTLPPAYAPAGFAITSVRRLAAGQLASWPSTWAKHLGHGRARPGLSIEAWATARSGA